MKTSRLTAVAAVAAATLAAPSLAAAEPVAGVTADGKLTRFDTAAPGTLQAQVPITGLGSDTLVGLDARPKTGTVVGLGRSGRLYTIDPTTGAATGGPSLVDGAGAPIALTGDAHAVDFNPVPDRLRVIGDTGQNLRVNVDTGVTVVDGAINGGGGGRIVAAGYTNSTFSPTQPTTTTLYDIDAAGDRLVIQNPPNNGVLMPVGPLGLAVDDRTGFDISGASGTAFLVANDALSTVDLTTGKATPVGGFGAESAVVDLTVLPAGTPLPACEADDSGAQTTGPVSSLLFRVHRNVIRANVNGQQRIPPAACQVAGLGL